MYVVCRHETVPLYLCFLSLELKSLSSSSIPELQIPRLIVFFEGGEKGSD